MSAPFPFEELVKQAIKDAGTRRAGDGTHLARVVKANAGSQSTERVSCPVCGARAKRPCAVTD